VSTEQKHKILRTLAHSPKHLRYFTEGEHGVMAVSPRHMERFIDELELEGMLVRCPKQLRITEAGKEEIAKPTSIASPVKVCAASTKEPYVPPKWNVRAGADQNLQYRSRGIDA
jgi:hypothetical protein